MLFFEKREKTQYMLINCYTIGYMFSEFVHKPFYTKCLKLTIYVKALKF